MRLLQKLILVCAVLFLSSCAAIVDKSHNKNKVILPPSSATISSLLIKADEYQTTGQQQRSLLTLERAIQIEPVDPVPWYRAAQTHFSLAHYNQAIEFARRAASLSSAYTSLRRGCWRLIAKSHTALGQIQQARLADRKADTL